MPATRKPRDLQVAVFGAGIAGLTAAHELIERGFRVEVWERDEESVVDRLVSGEDAVCAVGGMARTQWAQIDPIHDEPGMRRALPLDLYLDDQRFYFEPGTARLKPEEQEKLQGLLARARGRATRFHVLGFKRVPADADEKQIDGERAKYVKGVIEHELGPDVVVRADAGGIGANDDWTLPPAQREYAIVQIVDNWLPGEHGFRFFPAFYRHVFDTMSRTPIPDEDQEAYLETPWTVLDNVIPTAFMGIATERSRTLLRFRRRPTGSVQEIFDQLQQALEALGHTLDDIARFQLMLFKYMTSCSARRETYEHQSWSEFIGAAKLSPTFRQYIESTAETLVGMQAARSDARTYGNISVQMLRDQLSTEQRTDGTLNGPTSTAWFDHWRRYLQVQGVEFRRGRLEAFKLNDGEPFAVVFAGDKDDVTILSRDYFVLALPALELKRLACQNPDLGGKDFERIRRFNLGDPKEANTGGSLEHMSGIQFYLPTDLEFLRGHLILPDTAWRLSAVSQPQFWVQKRGWWSGYGGIVSVDISNFHAESPDPHDPRSNWVFGKTPDQIADRIWGDLHRCLNDKLVDIESRQRGVELPNGVARMPAPRYYHIDDTLVFDANERLVENRSPYLLTLTGQYPHRPGRPGGYEVNDGRIVLAGVLMQTFTRLTSMEAANESGRHAVNAILDAEKLAGERCRIWNPEDHEVDDFRILVELDAQLMELELPHLIDILDMREVPRALLRPDPDLNQLDLPIP